MQFVTHPAYVYPAITTTFWTQLMMFAKDAPIFLIVSNVITALNALNVSWVTFQIMEFVQHVTVTAWLAQMLPITVLNALRAGT